MQKARIKLTGTDPKKLDEICRQIKEIAQKVGVEVSGPIPLPTKHLVVVTRKAPDGRGTETWDKWEMRIHKRIVEVVPNERVMRQIMRIHIPEGVNIEIVFKT